MRIGKHRKRNKKKNKKKQYWKNITAVLQWHRSGKKKIGITTWQNDEMAVSLNITYKGKLTNV